MNPFRHIGRTLWKENRPVARPLPTQDSTKMKHADVHPCIEQDSNSEFQCSSSSR